MHDETQKALEKFKAHYGEVNPEYGLGFFYLLRKGTFDQDKAEDVIALMGDIYKNFPEAMFKEVAQTLWGTPRYVMGNSNFCIRREPGKKRMIERYRAHIITGCHTIVISKYPPKDLKPKIFDQDLNYPWDMSRESRCQ